jgi:RNA polymerase sigma-70 factor (ECF subfamily)
MDDQTIVALFFARDEAALTHTQNKYAKYCQSIAMRILGCREDAEECVNDAYRRAWESIPPTKPQQLSSYMGLLTRRLAFNRARERQADKRGGGELPLLLDELAECIPDTTGETSDDFVVRDALNAFLAALPQRTRTVFLCRYWYAQSVAEIATACHMSISSVNTLLCRTRKQLAEHLKEQHIEL